MDYFDKIADKYAPMIYSIIRSLHIYKNKEEFFQTGLIALWEASKSFNAEKGNFEGYAYRYIKGRMMTELTKMNTIADRTVYPKEEFWELIEEPQAAETLPVQLVLSYCDDLTPNQKKWVLYTCLEFLSIKEIAEKEKVSISAVKSWRKGAKKRISEGLEILD